MPCLGQPLVNETLGSYTTTDCCQVPQ